jgi:AraC-like DNA-binding protein
MGHSLTCRIIPACRALAIIWRLFAQAFGETPHEFVTWLRMEHAKKLLLAGNHSVTDICLDAGYDWTPATKAWGRSARAFIR